MGSWPLRGSESFLGWYRYELKWNYVSRRHSGEMVPSYWPKANSAVGVEIMGAYSLHVLSFKYFFWISSFAYFYLFFWEITFPRRTCGSRLFISNSHTHLLLLGYWCLSTLDIYIFLSIAYCRYHSSLIRLWAQKGLGKCEPPHLESSEQGEIS